MSSITSSIQSCAKLAGEVILDTDRTQEIQIVLSWRQICLIIFTIYCIADMHSIIPLELEFLLTLLVFIPKIGYLVSVGIITYWCMTGSQLS